MSREPWDANWPMPTVYVFWVRDLSEVRPDSDGEMPAAAEAFWASFLGLTAVVPGAVEPESGSGRTVSGEPAHAVRAAPIRTAAAAVIIMDCIDFFMMISSL